MRIKSANTTTCKKCLQRSMPVEMMIHIAKHVNPNYDFYRRSGIKEGMPVPVDYAAARIVQGMVEDGYYVDFAETLIEIDAKGYKGRSLKIGGLEGVIAGLVDEGYAFDKQTGQFFENQRERVTLNWGRLQEGDERRMALLRLDIVGNSELVKNNAQAKIKKAYNDVRDIVNRAVVSRIGRLWSWEGDGALAAFLFGPIEKTAVFAGMEILHEIFFYNRLRNPLDSPINLRLGTQMGQVKYYNSEIERLQNEIVKQAIAFESLAAVNSLSISYKMYLTMEQNIVNLFGAEKNTSGNKYRLYTLGLEK